MRQGNTILAALGTDTVANNEYDREREAVLLRAGKNVY